MIAIAPIPIPVARAVLVILVIVVPATRPTIVDTLVPTFAEVPVPAATVTDQDYIGLDRRLFGERKRQRVGIACSQYGHSADGDGQSKRCKRQRSLDGSKMNVGGAIVVSREHKVPRIRAASKFSNNGIKR